MYCVNNSGTKNKAFKKCERFTRILYLVILFLLFVCFEIICIMYNYIQEYKNDSKCNSANDDEFKLYEIFELLQFSVTVIPLTLIFIPLIFMLKKYHNHEFKEKAKSIFYFYIFELVSASLNLSVYIYSSN